jgi:CRISPR-associated endoribonuclease Cas6
MRLHFMLSQNTKTLPYNYQNYLISAFHKWMGWNNIHDSISLYSLSWLSGGKACKTGFDFPNGASWFISVWDESVAKRLVDGSMKQPEVCNGMQVAEIKIQETPEFGVKERFVAASPIFIRKYTEDKKAVHLIYSDAEADKYLTETLKKKLNIAGIEGDVKVYFDKNYSKPKTKLVTINGIQNRASFCPVIIEGDPEAVKFAWNVGIGHSTGCGFGAVN